MANTAANQIARSHFGAKRVKALAAIGITIIGITALPDASGSFLNSDTGYCLDNNGEHQVRRYLEVLALVDNQPQAQPCITGKKEFFAGSRFAVYSERSGESISWRADDSMEPDANGHASMIAKGETRAEVLATIQPLIDADNAFWSAN